MSTMAIWRTTILTACLAIATSASHAGAKPTRKFDPPQPPPDLEQLGANIQRTMTLLATSTPQKRNRVRILFYGQSVTRNPWWKTVADHLRKTYPHADLEVANKALGGYSAPTLIHTAEHDLYPYYPDLLIFHVYGGVKGGQQEEIIRRVRQRTTSEVVLWTSHFRWPRDLARDGDPNDPGAQRLTKADETRSAMIRDIAKKFGCELAEVRERFRKYLADHKLFPKDTLGDSVHPNKLGNFLIASLLIPSLRYDPKFPNAPWKDLVTDIATDAKAVKRGANGSLELTFDGNRIDIIAAHAKAPKLGTAKVLIDGKTPSAFPEIYYHTRPSRAPHTGWPAINRIDHTKPLVLEKWTAKILECDPEKRHLAFEVIGSVTGPDGKGTANKKFVSNSGRVVIDRRRWMVCHSLRYRKKPLPKDYKVTWEVKPLFVDVYQAPKTDDAAKEYATTLAQGLANGRHTLKLVPNSDGALPIAAFRVYGPPLR